MKIIILGAGQVGASVAENLASEDNDITLVDLDRERLAYLPDRYDIIESAGVLHHMADPLAGWRVLRGLLRRARVEAAARAD